MDSEQTVENYYEPQYIKLQDGDLRRILEPKLLGRNSPQLISEIVRLKDGNWLCITAANIPKILELGTDLSAADSEATTTATNTSPKSAPTKSIGGEGNLNNRSAG